MKKTLLLLFVLILIIFPACSEESSSTSSKPEESISDVSGEESSIESETSEKISLDKMYPNHQIDQVARRRYTANAKGISDTDRENYILNENGEIIKTFICDYIFNVTGNQNLLYVCMLDGSAYFIDANGERIDDITWDYLAPWDFNVDGVILGKLAEEYFVLDWNAKIIEQINTEPESFEEYDGLTIASLFINHGWFYGVMKDGEFIIKPQFQHKPIIKNGGIVFNNNVFDELSSVGYIYDYSGKLVKKIYGEFEANQGFDYIIERERNDRSSVDDVYSILDYSGKKLYTAPMGVSIDLIIHHVGLTQVEPYHVRLNGEIVHLEELIDEIKYPPVIISDYADAKDISSEQLPVIRTPYLATFYRQYPVTDELKTLVKEKLLEYLELANITFDEKNFSYFENAEAFYAEYVDGDVAVTSYCNSVCVGINRQTAHDSVSMSDPVVQTLCKMLFKNNEKLKIVPGSNGELFRIFEEKDTAYETVLSMTRKHISVVSYNDETFLCWAIDRSDESIFTNYTFNSISYDEAIEELRKGKVITHPESYIQSDYLNANIEGAEFKYILITYCMCEECFDIGYYIPCYCFYLRDKYSPQIYGEFYVPAIDINELNEYLESISQPHINHYWTEK